MAASQVICPEPDCGWSPSDDETVCPRHRRHALPPEVAAYIEQAPFLGHAIDERYVLDGFIGGGAMGSVYRALDARLGRHVAIKVLLPQFTSTPGGKARFAREARALSGLRSTHSVTVHDSGVIESGPIAGVAYMIMELLDGESLQQHAKRRTLPLEEVAEILHQVSRSLQEAHDAGIVHRDLKPGNILVSTEPDGRRLVKVIDFGVARVEGSDHTGTGAVLGTPTYMAPEQCQGNTGQADARADVYALGIVLYQLLAGRPPFVADHPMAVMLMHVSEPPPPLPGADADPRRSAVDAVLQRALAKAPEDRFPTVVALDRAFTAAVGGQSSAQTLATGEGWPAGALPTGVAEAPPTTHRLPLIAVAIGLLVGAVALALWARSDDPAPEPAVVLSQPAVTAAPAAALDATAPPAEPAGASLRRALDAAITRGECERAAKLLEELRASGHAGRLELDTLGQALDGRCAPDAGPPDAAPDPEPLERPRLATPRRRTPRRRPPPPPAEKAPAPPAVAEEKPAKAVPAKPPSGKPTREL